MYKVGSDTKMRSSDPNNTTEVMQIETPTSLDLDLDTTTRDLESSKSHHDKVLDVEALEQTNNDENSSLKDIWIDVLVKFGASLAILLFVVTLGIIFAFLLLNQTKLENNLSEMTEEVENFTTVFSQDRINQNRLSHDMILPLESLPITNHSNEFQNEIQRLLFLYFGEMAYEKLSDGNYYLMKDDKMNYEQAISACKNIHGKLLEFPHPGNPYAKLKMLTKHFKIKFDEIWLALDDLESEGLWKWSFSQVVFPNNSSLWAPGEPDDLDPSHDCVEIREADDDRIELFDVSCDGKYHVICEKVEK